MPTNTQTDAVLSLTLDTVDYACQLTDATLTYPSTGEATITPVACGGDPVSVPGDTTPGSITGTFFKDTASAGIDRALTAAYEADSTVAFVWTESNGEGVDLVVTGTAKVRSLVRTFAPSKLGTGSLDLSVITAATTYDITDESS